MKCLDDAQVQALVDNEAADDVRAHVASCAGCGDRLEKQRGMTEAAVLALDLPAPMPSTLQRRVEQGLVSPSTPGATRLRESAPAGRWRRSVWGAGVVAVATLAVVLFVVPM